MPQRVSVGKWAVAAVAVEVGVATKAPRAMPCQRSTAFSAPYSPLPENPAVPRAARVKAQWPCSIAVAGREKSFFPFFPARAGLPALSLMLFD